MWPTACLLQGALLPVPADKRNPTVLPASVQIPDQLLLLLRIIKERPVILERIDRPGRDSMLDLKFGHQYHGSGIQETMFQELERALPFNLVHVFTRLQ